MRFAVIYLSTLAVMLPLDFAFLGTIGKKLFAANVGDMVLDTPRLPPAIVFYALYLAGVVIFVNGTAPANWTHNLVYGALFGVFCYAQPGILHADDAGDAAGGCAEARSVSANPSHARRRQTRRCSQSHAA